MTEIMLSIRPEWCKKIIDGEKTIEVRKTKPKCDVPFKCYIYCTKPTPKEPRALYTSWGFTGLIHRKNYNYIERHENTELLSGKVIGEFICNKIAPIFIYQPDLDSNIKVPDTAMTEMEIIDYLGNGKLGCGWLISDLIIYDKPKELSEFNISRPPQSWCYVEGV